MLHFEKFFPDMWHLNEFCFCIRVMRRWLLVIEFVFNQRISIQNIQGVPGSNANPKTSCIIFNCLQKYFVVIEILTPIGLRLGGG